MEETEEFEEEVKRFPESSVYNSRGKISVSIQENTRANFFVKCYNMKLTPSKFLKICLELFLSDDATFMELIKEKCTQKMYHNKKYIAVRDKEGKAKKEYEENFMTDEEYIKKLYDLIESEEQ